MKDDDKADLALLLAATQVGQVKLTDNLDIMTLIVSFLSRKKKFHLREVSRDFRDYIVPRAMLSLKFYLTATLENAYFCKFIQQFTRVNKVAIEEIYVKQPLVAERIGESI